ncbi:MAG: GNAT family N-acetyltransferase, partial [candidate division Zixibacteria bacterium]|nr:GNAT family N-acetyltransferase [candidate division Zixibacteria bacterium]
MKTQQALSSPDDLHIRLCRQPEEAVWCAQMMADSEPWITLQRSSEEALGLFRDPGREAYVAVTHGQPCGFVLIMMQGAFAGYVQSLGVAPDFRGRGIGSRLMGFAETRIFRESPNVFVCVSSFNMDARRL